MDIVTQAILGATVAQSAARKEHIRLATMIGLVAGVIADADVLIRSSTDPLLSLEYHRHFTHSIFFIPIGALIAFCLFWPFLRNRLSASAIYGYCFLGYLLSGFIDACTSYGTHLLWPLMNTRIAWNVVSIVDPVFTLLLVVGVVASIKSANTRYSRIALVLAGCYLLVAAIQLNRAEQSIQELAAQRGHEIERIVVKPTVANNLLWRSVYLADNIFYIDAVRVAAEKRIYPGASIKKFNLSESFPDLKRDTTLFRDIKRFEHFSDDFVSHYPGRPEVLGDVRYAMSPVSTLPLWGIEINSLDTGQPVKFESYRVVSKQAKRQFIAMLLGKDTH